MPGRDAIAGLIPHAGRMCLLEQLLEWSPGHIVLETRTHSHPDNPLRTRGRLRALHLCEYGAQAMAVHGGLIAAAAGESRPAALLVAVREVELARAFLEDLPGELRIEAHPLLRQAASWQYRFRALHAGEQIGQGRLAAMALGAGRAHQA
jgi:predicted hotdog family 3-hydroxylacyl-ACP dehydratase